MRTDEVKKKASGLEKFLIVLFSIIIAASVICVVAVVILNSKLLINNDTPNGDGIIDTEIVTPKEIKDKYVNFLVAGIDYQEGSTRGHLTDIIMLVSFDIEGKKVNVMQIPRDTFIGNVTNTGKINAVYSKKTDGGIEGLATVVSLTFNVTIDHYITLNMDGFKSIIDSMGGVEVDVPISFTLEGATIEKGLQTLTGFQAEKVVRERHSYANADLGRMETQQIFMKAFVQKVFSLGKKDITALVLKNMKYVTTDLTPAEVLGYYDKLLLLESATGINFHTAVVKKGGSYRGNSVVLLDKEKTAELLNTYFRPYTDPVSPDEIGISEL